MSEDSGGSYDDSNVLQWKPFCNRVTAVDNYVDSDTDTHALRECFTASPSSA